MVVAAYWLLPWRKQNVFLLIASYFFYGWWDWRFLLLMGGSTVIDFLIAKRIGRSQDQSTRRILLLLSLVLNFGFLAIFKYFNFFIDSFSVAASALGLHNLPLPMLRILLPPGISFYTFQEVAYIVDVYRRKLEPAESLVDYALFISFFPHLIAGPIQRPGHLLPQVQKPRRFDQDRFFDGLLLILLGLFRKCVIADNCALLANAAFDGRFGTPNLPVVLLGTYAFAWQIYGDFSGYSDIARGSAQLLGFHFMVNFRQPYLAQNLQDFWRRWHISLSTWLRDYLYIPLGGSAHGRKETYRNLLITMLLGGLWHGANWTFVIWGAVHGVWLSIERFFRELMPISRRKFEPLGLRWRPMIAAWWRRILIFHVVCITWIFFRAPSLSQAIEFFKGLGNWAWLPEYWTALRFLALFTIPLFLVDILMEQRDEEYLLQGAMPLFRVAVGMAALLLLTFFAANEANAFIYFRF